jgi:monofunctional biosynthetic peptidoglycan transglycosylase
MVIRAIENSADKKKTHSATIESIDNISVNLQKAVIASEDGSFLIHNGFDFKAMQKHIKVMRGRKIKEVVPYRNKQLKNVFLWQGRSYFRRTRGLFLRFYRIYLG